MLNTDVFKDSYRQELPTSDVYYAIDFKYLYQINFSHNNAT